MSYWTCLTKGVLPGQPGWADFYDVIGIPTSGGKDSEPAMHRTMELVTAAGAVDKTFGLHLWLDERHDDPGIEPMVEWPQVPELAAEQSTRNGLPLGDGGGWAVWDARTAGADIDREVWAGRVHYARRDFDGDLIDDFATRRKRDGSPRGFARKGMRYCTGEWKTAVGRAFTEYVCEQVRRERGLTRPVRVLQVMGFRSQESADRARRNPFGINYRVSAKASRWVWEWLPIHALTLDQVWADIRARGVPYHPVYDQGMTRLSCRACIMASRADLARTKRLAPATAARIMRIERDLGDSFQHGRSLTSITAEPGPTGFSAYWTTCPTCNVRVLAEAGEAERYCPAHAATGPWDNRNQPAPFLSGWTELECSS